MKRILVIVMLLFSTLVHASIYKDEWIIFNGKDYYVKNAAEQRKVEEMIQAAKLRGRDFDFTFAKVGDRRGQNVTCYTYITWSARWEEFKERRTDCNPGDPRPY